MAAIVQPTKGMLDLVRAQTSRLAGLWHAMPPGWQVALAMVLATVAQAQGQRPMSSTHCQWTTEQIAPTQTAPSGVQRVLPAKTGAVMNHIPPMRSADQQFTSFFPDFRCHAYANHTTPHAAGQPQHASTICPAPSTARAAGATGLHAVQLVQVATKHLNSPSPLPLSTMAALVRLPTTPWSLRPATHIHAQKIAGASGATGLHAAKTVAPASTHPISQWKKSKRLAELTVKPPTTQ